MWGRLWPKRWAWACWPTLPTIPRDKYSILSAHATTLCAESAISCARAAYSSLSLAVASRISRIWTSCARS